MRPSKASRKRALDDENGEPFRFLQAYYAERGIPESPDDDNFLLDDCVRRAEHARESFKRWRMTDSGYDSSSKEFDSRMDFTGCDILAAPAEAAVVRLRNEDGPAVPSRGDDPSHVNVALLTPQEKYQRRLVNNRRSASAARVYQEVLRREHTHALRNVSIERNKLREDVQRLEDSLRKLREENERLAAIETNAAVVKGIGRDVSEPEQDTFLDDVVGASEKSTPSTIATVTVATVFPVPKHDCSETPTTGVARALGAIASSQTFSQDDTEDKNGLLHRPAQSTVGLGWFNSQNSQGDSFINVRIGCGPSVLDELGDSSDLFVGSQLGISQVLASQGSASQGSACHGLSFSQVFGFSQEAN